MFLSQENPMYVFNDIHPTTEQVLQILSVTLF